MDTTDFDFDFDFSNDSSEWLLDLISFEQPQEELQDKPHEELQDKPHEQPQKSQENLLSECPLGLISVEQPEETPQVDPSWADQFFESTNIVEGFRFVPTEQELINSYLLKKVNNMLPPIAEIVDLNIYETNLSSIKFNDKRFLRGERFFFVERQTMTKNENGKRPRRTITTQNIGGYWKANTGDKEIVDEDNKVIGYKKSLTFFQYEDLNNKDRHKAKKSNWIMHEYRLPTHEFQKWVVCKIREKSKIGNHDEL